MTAPLYVFRSVYVYMYTYRLYVYIYIICTYVHIYVCLHISIRRVLAPGSEINVLGRRLEGVRQKGVLATHAQLLILRVPHRGFSSW